MTTRRQILAGGIAAIGFPLLSKSSPVRSLLGAEGSEIISAEETVPTASDYVQEGLIGLFDGEENVGWGVHESNPSQWANLIDGKIINLNSGVIFGDKFATTDDTFSAKSFGEAFSGRSQYRFEYITSEICFETESSERQFILIDMYRRSCMGVWDTNIGVGYWRAVGFGRSTIGEVISATSIYNTTTDNIPSYQYVDGQFKELVNVNFSQPLSTAFSIGGSPYDRAFSGKLYCVRMYDRPLSEEEIIHNYTIDKYRFGTL